MHGRLDYIFRICRNNFKFTKFISHTHTQPHCDEENSEINVEKQISNQKRQSIYIALVDMMHTTYKHETFLFGEICAIGTDRRSIHRQIHPQLIPPQHIQHRHKSSGIDQIDSLSRKEKKMSKPIDTLTDKQPFQTM